MNKEIAMRMFDLLNKEEKTSEDVSFLANNISGFCDLVLESTTHAMVTQGIDEEMARNMLGTLVGIAKMAGSSAYNDFIITANLLEK